jgi:hypothetical protein
VVVHFLKVTNSQFAGSQTFSTEFDLKNFSCIHHGIIKFKEKKPTALWRWDASPALVIVMYIIQKAE